MADFRDVYINKNIDDNIIQEIKSNRGGKIMTQKIYNNMKDIEKNITNDYLSKYYDNIKLRNIEKETNMSENDTTKIMKMFDDTQ